MESDAVKMAIERIKARFHPHYGIDGASDSKQLARDCQTLIAALEQAGEPVDDPARDRVILASVRLGKWMSAALDDPKVCDEMKADIREWFSAGEPVAGCLPTLQRLGQEFDAGEAKASFGTALAELGKGNAVQWWGTEDSQHAERMNACKARCQRWGDCDEGDGSCAECDSDMAEALETTESMKRRLRNYEDRIDRFFQSDGLRAVRSALATLSQPDPQSRGQFDDIRETALQAAADANGGYINSKTKRIVIAALNVAQSRGQAFDGEGEA